MRALSPHGLTLFPWLRRVLSWLRHVSCASEMLQFQRTVLESQFAAAAAELPDTAAATDSSTAASVGISVAPPLAAGQTTLAATARTPQ